MGDILDIRIAIIGQSNFAADVLELLLSKNYKVVGVFTIPDQASREDVLATTAAKYEIPVFKVPSWRLKKVVRPQRLQSYLSVGATLNVLPYCSQFIPLEVIEGAKYGSICYHPSLLPKHRGASAISWTMIEGDDVAGFSIFWADAGLDTGPILLQKQCKLEPTDTLDTIYKRFLYPQGVQAIADAVDMVKANKAPRIPQTEITATYDPPMFKKENQVVNLQETDIRIWNFIRALDSVPGAIAYVINDENSNQEEEIRLFGAHLYSAGFPVSGRSLKLKGALQCAIHPNGLAIQAISGGVVNVKRVKRNNKLIQAKDWFKESSEIIITDLSETELNQKAFLRSIWESILKISVDEETDFFESGAGSMDVVRLVEECKDAFDVPLENEHVFMAPVFNDFFITVIKLAREDNTESNVDVIFDGFILHENKRQIPIPTQMFINGKFLDASNGNKLDIINPTNAELIAKVASATETDVNLAVEAAYKAFNGSWKQISARQRGHIMLKLADLMEQYREDLATIESVDSGAVYTLALKTHVGMSIDAWRYFAGWTDKIEGSTIPVSPARPNNILTFTKKEPIGVCGLITPWNYPLMMLSWKMAACIAAGNTCVIKPAQACPLTALKFAELTVKAGFPPGVINVVTGTGSIAGQAIANHPLVRKLGFTGSTQIGKHIMKSCAESNLKKCSLELGGKSPLIIYADCDLDKAIKHGMSSVFFNKGENCIAAGRIFVEDTIHDEFVYRVIQDIKKMVIGDPLNRSTTHGPQNHRAHFEKLIEFCEKGVEEGASLMYGGKPVANVAGFFFEPTVFTDVHDSMFIAAEESFGPIMIVSKFHGSDVDTLMKRVNNLEYGLASGVFTKDINKALQFADNIEAGTVFVNVYNKTDVAAPFGGFKESGFGKDLGKEALNEYLKTKCVTIEY